MSLTAERARELLSYCSETGTLRWKADRYGIHQGEEAGRQLPTGYRQVSVDGRRYYTHRIVWLVTYGDWPPHQIDHINGCPSDNRIVNLRLATPTQNQRNRKVQKNNSLGVSGVSLHRATGKYQVFIKVARKNHYLGLFNTVEEASAVRREAEASHFKEFTRVSS